MIVTLNCDWTIPEEEVNSQNDNLKGLCGISAIIGTNWKPLCPANENMPKWLKLYE